MAKTAKKILLKKTKQKKEKKKRKKFYDSYMVQTSYTFHKTHTNLKK